MADFIRKLYFPSSGTPGISPDFESKWDDVSLADSVAAYWDTPSNTGFATETRHVVNGVTLATSAAIPYRRYVLIRQYVSDPFGSSYDVSYSGTKWPFAPVDGFACAPGYVKAQATVTYDGKIASLGTKLCAIVRAVDSGGDTVGYLHDFKKTSDLFCKMSRTAMDETLFWSTEQSPIQWVGTTPTTQEFTISATDRVVVELGVYVGAFGAAPPSFPWTLDVTVDFEFGDPLASSDLPLIDQTTLLALPLSGVGSGRTYAGIFSTSSGGGGIVPGWKFTKPTCATMKAKRMQYPPVEIASGGALNRVTGNNGFFNEN